MEILGRYGGEAKVLAGGQSLLPVMKLRLAEPKALVDINRIPNLAYIREDGGWLRIGATSRTNDLNDSDIVKRRYPILTDAAAVIADPLVRNMGTVGGNVSHGDPANDLPACMLALGAQFVVRGPKGTRTIPALSFYQDTFVTALEPDEILTEIQIPTHRAGQGTAYEKATFPWAASGRALGLGRPEGLTKLLVDPQTQRVLGAGMVGVSAGDLIAEVVHAIEMGAEAEDIALSIHPHPTLSETVAFAAEMAEGTITDLYAPKREKARAS